MPELIYIAASLAAQRCSGEADFEQRIIKAMRGALEFSYMLTDEDQLYLAALTGALVESEEDERRHLDRLIKSHKALAAAVGGIPVDFDTLLLGFEDLPPWPCRPIRELWTEARG